MPGFAARLCFLALLLSQAKAPLAAADEALTIPFDYSTSRNTILLHVRINDKPALLILDTGSAHTIIEPEFLGIARSELEQTHLSSSGGGFVGDAIGREITLQVGNWKWQKRRVAVMDLSQVLSVYKEKPNGVLGLDFLQEFSRILIDMKSKTLTLVR